MSGYVNLIYALFSPSAKSNVLLLGVNLVPLPVIVTGTETAPFVLPRHISTWNSPLSAAIISTVIIPDGKEASTLSPGL